MFQYAVHIPLSILMFAIHLPYIRHILKYHKITSLNAKYINLISYSATGTCPGEVTQEPGGNVLTWPDTPINEMAESKETCQVYSAQGKTLNVGLCRGGVCVCVDGWVI